MYLCMLGELVQEYGYGHGSLHAGVVDKPSVTKNSLFIRFSMFCYNFAIFFHFLATLLAITQLCNKVEIQVRGS